MNTEVEAGSEVATEVDVGRSDWISWVVGVGVSTVEGDSAVLPASPEQAASNTAATAIVESKAAQEGSQFAKCTDRRLIVPCSNPSTVKEALSPSEAPAATRIGR